MVESSNKSSRVLFIYEELINGHLVKIDDIATRFNVSSRTVQRDIDEVKGFCVNGICWNQGYKFVFYDYMKKGYLLASSGIQGKE